MCGIAGAWWTEGKAPGNRETLEQIAKEMGEQIAYRGPDGHATWSDPQQALALVHRRLAILDLSPAGKQPMLSDSGRYVMTFNGEIYNFKDLKNELSSNRPWRGHSDTEILLRAIEEWGIETTLKKSVGMFAIALWDTHAKTLTLARDRLGEKPLYYDCRDGHFFFSSEIRAFEAIPQWTSSLDVEGLAAYFRHNYVPGPHSIFSTVKKLPPAHWFQIALADLKNGTEPRPIPYWTLHQAVENGAAHRFASDQEAVENIHSVIKQSVAEKLVADVPVGLFLSGGIDSSLTTALAQASSGKPVRTFSIGFTEPSFDESPYAREVARHLGTDHTELLVSSADAQKLIPEIPAIYDEPFADSSQIPTVLLARLTRKHVTVSLSGDAGDELFGGYSRYIHHADLSRAHSMGPRWARHALARGMSLLTEDAMKRLLQPIEWIHPRTSQKTLNLLRKGKKAAIALKQPNLNSVYLDLVTHWRQPPVSFETGTLRPLPLEAWMQSEHPPFETEVERLMYLDTLTYLPDDILVKVDRATMSASLEARAPFLDHRVLEAAWRLPSHLRVANRKGKVVLRQLLARYIPTELFERPKMGFGIPVDQWLGNELRDWCESYLSVAALDSSGLLDAHVIRSKWNEHVEGKANWGYWLWDVIQFQAWFAAKKKFLRT